MPYQSPGDHILESLFGGSSRGAAATRIPLTEDRSSSIGDGRPLRPSTQLREGRTWSGEGGRGHPPSQPDQPNQPWRSMGDRCRNQIALTSGDYILNKSLALGFAPGEMA